MPRDIHEVLKAVWGYDRFRPMQEQVIRSAMAGTDTLALMPTGGGKSLCFQVPALAMGKLCVVVSPLIALMKDQVQRLRDLGVRAVAVTSAMSPMEMDTALESAMNGKVYLLYVSPERLGTDLFKSRLPRMPLGLIAVDEAHCISQWGYDFRPSYLLISALRESHPHVPVLALTASATPEVAQDIMRSLAFRKPHLLQGSFQRPELTFWVSHGEDKLGRLLRIVHKVPGTGIVYMRNRRGTVQIAQYLRHHGIAAEAYHAGLDLEERDRVQKSWTSGTIRYVAATNAFGMGIDKADVRCVVHMEPPPDLESYYQEAGRAGRDGKPSYAFLLAHPTDERKMREKLEASFPSLSEVRRVYQAFADKHRIAMGAGEFEAYEVDLQDLATRTTLPIPKVNSALKALELDGALALSEGSHTPSRVMMRATSEAIHHIRVTDERLGPVLEALLRMYAGMFEESVIVDEERIAQQTARAVKQVEQILRELVRADVIFYQPRSDAPMATLLEPRRDAQTLTLNPQALQLRRERAEARLEAMATYAFHLTGCREAAILDHFGQASAGRCGRCDNCKAMDRSSTVAEPPARWIVDEGGARTSPTTGS